VLTHVDIFNYQFLVYNGPKLIGGGDSWDVQVCALVACTGSTPDTCNNPVEDSAEYTLKTVFSTIEVAGDGFSSTYNAIPTTLLMESFPYDQYTFDKPVFGALGRISIKSEAYAGRIHTFGIYQATD